MSILLPVAILPSAAARFLAAAILMVLAAVLADGAAGCSSPPPGTSITVSTGGCGTGWRHPAPGWTVFQIHNVSGAGAEADLIDPANGAIYAEAAALGPGTTRPMRVDVGSGRYAFRCLIADTDAITGPAVRVGGHVRGAAAIRPVSTDDLLGAAREYHAYVTAGLDTLTAQTDSLAASIRSGDLGAARARWLPAHLTYERLGAAYGTFGRYDSEIDGRPDGLPGGVGDPGFTGFYRLEYGLWHGQSAAGLTGPADVLDRDVRALRAAFPSMEIDLLDLGLRTHEILENALQFQLTGHDDYGSGTTLATTQANIDGTTELLRILNPLLVTRYPGLPASWQWLSRLQAQLAAARQPNGTWTPAGRLGTASRERIDAAAGQALEELAPIAVICEPRRTS